MTRKILGEAHQKCTTLDAKIGMPILAAPVVSEAGIGGGDGAKHLWRHQCSRGAGPLRQASASHAAALAAMPRPMTAAVAPWAVPAAVALSSAVMVVVLSLPLAGTALGAVVAILSAPKAASLARSSGSCDPAQLGSKDSDDKNQDGEIDGPLPTLPHPCVKITRR
jgi:hypothetical protein